MISGRLGFTRLGVETGCPGILAADTNNYLTFTADECRIACLSAAYFGPERPVVGLWSSESSRFGSSLDM